MVSGKRDIEKTGNKEEIENIEKHMKDGNRKRGQELKIMYTNIDGITPRLLELKDYVREEEPDVICLVETKLSKDIKIKIDENEL